MTNGFFMDVHQQQLDGCQPDFSNLMGKWRNLDPSTAGFLQLALCRDDGNYLLEGILANDGEPLDCGQVPAAVFGTMGAAKALGFHGEFHLQKNRLFVAALINMQICVVQTYRVEADQVPGIFYKEYFRLVPDAGGCGES